MKYIFKILTGNVFVMCFLAITAPFSLAGQMNRNFSADMVSTAGGQTIEAKIFVAGDKTRMETFQSTIITRSDKNVMWILMPTQGMYMEQSIDLNRVPRTSKEMPGELERVPLGPESIDGKPAQKYQVTYTQDGRQESMYQWIGDSDIPLKMQALDGSWSVEYRNVSTAPQPDSLFEVPAGLQKFAMPSMPSGMFPPDRMAPGEWTDEN